MEEKENLDTNLIYDLVIFYLDLAMLYLDKENCLEDQVKRDLHDRLITKPVKCDLRDRLITKPDADVDQYARIVVNAIKNFRKQGNDFCALDKCIEQAIDAELGGAHKCVKKT